MPNSPVNHAKYAVAARKALISLVIVCAAGGCSILISMLGVGNESVIMVFLLGVLFVCVATSSRVCGVISSFVSVMTFNFLFTEPQYTFAISRTSDLMLLAFFLVTAIVSGTVTLRLSQQMELASKNERTARMMYEIASGFLSTSGTSTMIGKGAQFINEYTGRECGIHMENAPDPDGEGDYLPYVLMNDTARLGELRVYGGPLDEDGEKIVQAVTTQLGIALEREHLVSEREEIRVAMEREKQRSMLLRSVAHDLRSPLTALAGACNLLADDYARLSDEQRRKLAVDMSEEILWLTGLVENILSMTRINEAQLIIHRQEEVIDDVVEEAVSHIGRLLNDRAFTVSLPEDIVTAPMDGKLIVQVILNLLENAVRHTPQGTPVSLSVERDGDDVRFWVCDEGGGVPEAISKRLFERFVTGDSDVADGSRGLGLGLAICKAIVDAHGGAIGVEPNVPHGSRFYFTLPAKEDGTDG